MWWCSLAVCVLAGIIHVTVAGSSSVRLLTFNTGLTPSVEQYKERRARIGPALAQVPADIACLQEVWSSKDMSSILSHVGDRHFRYSYSYLHDVSGSLPPTGAWESPCRTPAFVDEFLPCLEVKCNTARNKVDKLLCAKHECGLYELLDQQCITCLVMSEPSTFLYSCFYNLGSRFNVPGLLLLSRFPLKNVTLSGYAPPGKLLLPRSYIKAEVDGVGTVVCTHTTADLGPVYFGELNYASWRSRNMAEARTLMASFRGADRVVIMGDINGGPAVPASDVMADFEGFYDHVVMDGFTPGYVESVGICTWCEYNPLTKRPSNMILDHVFVRNFTINGALRVLDDHLPDLPFPVSDHFGIVVIVQ